MREETDTSSCLRLSRGLSILLEKGDHVQRVRDVTSLVSQTRAHWSLFSNESMTREAS